MIAASVEQWINHLIILLVHVHTDAGLTGLGFAYALQGSGPPRTFFAGAFFGFQATSQRGGIEGYNQRRPWHFGETPNCHQFL
jgi:hypothetical protein